MKHPLSCLTGIILLGLLVVPIQIFRKPEVLKQFLPSADEQGSSLVKGPWSAPVQIVEYLNFQCFSCSAMQPELEVLFQRYPGQIRLQFRHYPQEGNERSWLAHIAAQCAAEQGRFWEYHDLLFRQQPVWASVADPLFTFTRYAQELGLDVERFLREYHAPLIRKKVQSDRESGRSLSVEITPTFLIGDRRFVGPHQFKEEAVKWIEEMLRN